MPASTRELRRFGLLVGSVLVGLALVAFARHRAGPRMSVAAGLGLSLLFAGVLAPRALSPVHAVWMRFGSVVGWVNTRVLLGLLFFGVLTPLACFARLCGYDPLKRRPRPGVASYWITRTESEGTERYKRQF